MARAKGKASATDAAEGPDESFRVRATQAGIYGHVRRKPGDEFTIANEQAFSERWMEKVDDKSADASDAE